MGVVITGHNMVGIPTCNDYHVIYGGNSQLAMDNDITSYHKAI